MVPKVITAYVMISLFLSVTPILAAPPVFVTATVTPSGKTVVIPERAAEVAPNVFDLGVAVDLATGEQVEGRLIVHRRATQAQERAVSSGAKNQCYGFIVRNTKWRVVEPWMVNPANTRGLGNIFVADTLSASIAKWEDAADGMVDNGLGVNILGNGTATSSALIADTVAPDGQNEVYFANVVDANAIAVTIVWYNRFTKTLVEWDQVYDDVSYDWSAIGGAGKMDFDNIATHELGHAIGLADLYNSCTEETMYGYADYGEIKKRTLNAGDIAGANALY
ncbi:MAG: hypothetical protein A3B34_00570 [Candidatus Sungbacteria bacterium RIFCSPLOWO2_01_FULL_54_21]|uniref:Peptidase M10 metallopeptidase domain-containing protein n=1 Tax=Candidatus Sungbacteria bacterium RIFCSPLOWO2_01_FULL_54_21 TaxID=1802279 RepID=A0A1G2L7V1_9BACT|nr:MAG: hypothetical protein A2679_03045 [Candidatus Sungbacteria bacterium RIFCSPHIGHO2_01_FULL_54_26]OHA07716.1 MAG: hypothetical protein A3B34_00570 [Candidatus Sungbacteria bacterium RIFCSPLOWO2_01_FULL_54_21]